MLKYCVVINDKVYCYHTTKRTFVEAKLEAVADRDQGPIPNEALAAMIAKMNEELNGRE